MEDNQFKILATEVKAGLELLSVKMDDIKEKQEETKTIDGNQILQILKTIKKNKGK